MTHTDAETTVATPQRDQVASRWAEEEMTLAASSTTALRGHAAAAHGRALLDTATDSPKPARSQAR